MDTHTHAQILAYEQIAQTHLLKIDENVQFSDLFNHYFLIFCGLAILVLMNIAKIYANI